MQNIKKDYIWNTIGVFMQNLISPLLLIIVARVNGVLDAGLFSFAFSLAMIFWAFSIWGARTYQVSDTKKEFSTRSYILVRILLSLVVLAGSVVFCLLNNYDLIKTAIILSLVVYKMIESVSDAIYGVLQVNGRLYITGRSLLYKSALGLGLFVLFDYFTHNILLSSTGLVVGNLLILLLYDLPRAKKLDTIWFKLPETRRYFAEAISIIKRCAPIASVIFMSMFALLIPRYFIDVYHYEENGYFGILAMPITALTLLITFIIQPNVLRLSQLFSRQKYVEYKKLVRNIVLIILAFSVLTLPIVYFWGVEILTYVFSVDFADYRLALMIFVLGAAVNAFVTIFINLLTIMRHFKVQFYTLIFTNIALIFASLVVIPLHSVLGGIALYLSVNVIQLLFLIIAYYKAIFDDAKARNKR